MIFLIFLVIGIIIGAVASVSLSPFFSSSLGIAMVIARLFKDMGKKLQNFLEDDERR